MEELSLLMSNRRVFREGPQHSKLDMVAVFRGSRFPSEQRCEDGDQANAHWDWSVHMVLLRMHRATNECEEYRGSTSIFRAGRVGVL